MILPLLGCFAQNLKKNVRFRNKLKFPFSFCLQDEPIRLGPKSFACPYCSKTMEVEIGMKRHICTHTGKKPFKCSLCSYSAVQNSDLKKHYKRKHGHYDYI